MYTEYNGDRSCIPKILYRKLRSRLCHTPLYLIISDVEDSRQRDAIRRVRDYRREGKKKSRSQPKVCARHTYKCSVLLQRPYLEILRPAFCSSVQSWSRVVVAVKYLYADKHRPFRSTPTRHKYIMRAILHTLGGLLSLRILGREYGGEITGHYHSNLIRFLVIMKAF